MGPAGAMALIRGRGEKRASQEAGPRGLGHWDTPSIGRKRPWVAASASGPTSHPKAVMGMGVSRR
jgi:hypothetical protein